MRDLEQTEMRRSLIAGAVGCYVVGIHFSQKEKLVVEHTSDGDPFGIETLLRNGKENCLQSILSASCCSDRLQVLAGASAQA